MVSVRVRVMVRGFDKHKLSIGFTRRFCFSNLLFLRDEMEKWRRKYDKLVAFTGKCSISSSIRTLDSVMILGFWKASVKAVVLYDSYTF